MHEYIVQVLLHCRMNDINQNNNGDQTRLVKATGNRDKVVVQGLHDEVVDVEIKGDHCGVSVPYAGERNYKAGAKVQLNKGFDAESKW